MIKLIVIPKEEFNAMAVIINPTVKDGKLSTTHLAGEICVRAESNLAVFSLTCIDLSLGVKVGMIRLLRDQSQPLNTILLAIEENLPHLEHIQVTDFVSSNIQHYTIRRAKISYMYTDTRDEVGGKTD